MEEREHHELIDICPCSGEVEANIVISFLQENGIEAHTDSNLPHSIYPVAGDAMVYVHEDDAERARALLAERSTAAPLTEAELEGVSEDGENN